VHHGKIIHFPMLNSTINQWICKYKKTFISHCHFYLCRIPFSFFIIIFPLFTKFKFQSISSFQISFTFIKFKKVFSPAEEKKRRSKVGECNFCNLNNAPFFFLLPIQSCYDSKFKCKITFCFLDYFFLFCLTRDSH
jgi:hypothetical protein